jgi:glycine betaine/proline transport system ATP-binding protein
MALIDIDGLSTIFGPNPRHALQQVRGGIDKAALLAGSGHTLALHDVHLGIDAGEIFVVMGLSGSGKSTLARNINRLVDATAGRVIVDGLDVGALDAAQLIRLRRERVSMVFQRFGLLPHRDVRDNVAIALEHRGVARAQRQREAQRWIDTVGLAGVERQLPAQLSGGMQQRVGLARAWCAGTDIILMDDPFSALDPLIRSRLQDELLQMQAGVRRTIVFITHDLDEALRIGDRVAILKDGRLVQVGTPAQVLLQPADEHVASFTHDVNRARAWRVADALKPWPAQLPPPHDAVDAGLSVEQLLPRLIGRSAPLGVLRDGRLIGQVDVEALRRMLSRP